MKHSRQFTIGMLILLVSFFMIAGGGCKPRVRYLPGVEAVIVLEKGEPAPYKCFATTQQGMAAYYDWQQEQLKKKEDKPD